jgi:hypothetical protein
VTPMREGVESPAWTRALRDHREALGALLETIAAVEPEAWRLERAPGKWSPAQTAEHLALVYEQLSRDLTGAGTMKVRVPPWQQRLLRWFLLPHILFHQNVPLRVRSPREVRPSDEGLAQAEAARRLPELAERFEADLEAALDPAHAITHPYFGPIPALKALRFCAVHLEHHRRQLLSVLVP